MKKAILFDLDGTLANTLQDLADAVNTVLAANDLPVHPLDAYREFVGNGAKVLIDRASGREDATLLRAFLEEYDRRCLEKVVPYDGTVETLDRLLESGCRLGIVTNKPHAQALKIAAHLFGDRFTCVYGNQPDKYPRKPDPTVLKLAAAELGVPLSECVYVGDSDVDVITAHAGGIPCIGCAFGFRGEEELKSAGADAIAYSFTDLQKLWLLFD